MSKTTFPLGQIVATPGALETLEESGQSPADFLGRHVQGDWGDVCGEDKELNNQSLIDGSRILSVYRTLRNVRLWIITEGKDDHGRRAATAILLPEEY